MQLKSSSYTGVVDAGRLHLVARRRREALQGFLPNVVKNAPNKSIQLTTFDVFKRKIAESTKALEEEKAIFAKESKGKKK